MKKRVEFKYHPNFYKNEIPENSELPPDICQCCGEEVEEYYDIMYCIEDIECICFECIANGKAAEKFDGEFIQNAETEKVDDDKKTEMLFKRTPGYISWQGENWLACCNDYCAFVDYVGTKELEKMGIADEVFEEYDKKGRYADTRKFLQKKGAYSGYLFQCLHCGKYHLGVDVN